MTAPRDPRAFGPEAARESMWDFAQQSLDHAILLLDTHGVVVWANPGAAKILGAEADGIVGQPVDRFFTPEDRDQGVPQHEIRVALKHGSADDDRWMLRADGSRFWAAGITQSLKGADGEATGFVKILRNMTGMKMRLRTMENRAAALRADTEGHHAAISTVVHELRNPLSSISMATALLRHRIGDDDSLQPPLAMLERNVDFSRRLLDDLQDAGTRDTRKLNLQAEDLLLQEVLQSAIEAARHRAGDPPRNIDLLLPPGEPIGFRGDRLRMQQLFVNLIGNAIKYTREHGHISVRSTRHVDWIVVHIEDDGIGIAPDMLERIFVMFTQAETPMEHRGLGIGLALAKNIVELHGGSIQANSDGIGKGSDFVVRLPPYPPGTGPDPVRPILL